MIERRDFQFRNHDEDFAVMSVARPWRDERVGIQGGRSVRDVLCESSEPKLFQSEIARN